MRHNNLSVASLFRFSVGRKGKRGLIVVSLPPNQPFHFPGNPRSISHRQGEERLGQRQTNVANYFYVTVLLTVNESGSRQNVSCSG